MSRCNACSFFQYSMKVKVLIEYTDKFTKIRHYIGEEVAYSAERAEELEKRGIVEIIKEKKSDVAPTPKKKK